MKPWEALIDDAAKMCGSQNELARRLGCSSGTLSSARGGHATISREKLAQLAELLGRDPAELWSAQELANMERRNPFRRGVATAAAALAAVILSGIAPADSLAATATYGVSAQVAGIYIVAHWRMLASRCRQAWAGACRYSLHRHFRASLPAC
jgi:transcriptional regulator with XRE-family HTH domain